MTATFCQQMKAENGLARVLYDPTGRQLAQFGLDDTHQHIVLEEGVGVFHRRTGDNSTFANAVNELLAR